MCRVLIESDFPVEKGDIVGLTLRNNDMLLFDSEGKRIDV